MARVLGPEQGGDSGAIAALTARDCESGHAAGDPRAVVLLATLNGAAFLDEQLASLAAQDFARLDVVAGDDGSTDGTLDILRRWQRRWRRGVFTVVEGPGQGFAENFRQLILRPEAAPADYVAFCDQDDVWDRDKLSAAIGVLARSDGAALYGSRTRLVDAQLRVLGQSPLFREPPHFRNAIVQNIAGGNTMVLNRAAFALVAESARRAGFVSHDWWSYLIVSGAGGTVHYDPEPRIAYRQHGRNAVGDNSSLAARWRRMGLLLSGGYRAWNDANLEALDACEDMLTGEARRLVAQFKSLRRGGPLRRLLTLKSCGFYRQLFGGRITLALAVLLRKV